MSRRAISITCSNEELNILQKWLNGSKIEKRLHDRAQIILLCNKGMRNDQIAKKIKRSIFTVSKWRKRFYKYRIQGLVDKFRSGKPKTYDDNVKQKIFKLIEKKPPKGQSTWDGKSIAKKLNISSDYVWRTLKKEGIHLQRRRSWCISTDPEFAAKAADIIGLYLNPPEKALVLSVDEKPGIQAIERKTGFVLTSNKKIVTGLQNTYKRNGTLNLFAALNVLTGYVKTKITNTKKRIDFRSFMEDVTRDIPAEKEIHVILDNYCTHKKNNDWLEKHPNVHFHFTPTSASWLNQVEIWFGILTKKALRGASFSNITKLKQAIKDFIKVYHKNAKPFVWRKREVRGSQLRNTITNLCN